MSFIYVFFLIIKIDFIKYSSLERKKKETVVYYLTSEKPTSKVRLLAFKTRSFVISSFFTIF